MEAVTSRDTIRMTIPALLAYVRLPRVAIAGLATRSGFSYDEVEDLRLAVGEVCQVLLDGADRAGSLTIDFTVARGTMRVEVSLAGIPAISIPGGLADGLPVGIQLAGPAFSENRVLDAAHALEQAIGFDGGPARA